MKNTRNSRILDNKGYLYLTEFFSGTAVMAVELGASRLMAPYFSSSQIVWTIIIGTIMIAMALGNIYGGRSADRNPDPDRLYRRLLIASVWIAAIPVLGKYIILGVSALLIFSVNHWFLIWAAFAACFIIFVFPLFLLGTVTPSLVKYSVDSLDDNGKTVGMLGAFNTIGSIIGTFLPTFASIPAVGTAVTFLIFSGVLLLIAAIYFISVKRQRRMVCLCLILFIVCCIFGNSDSFAFWEDDLTYEGESVYNYLQVRENDRQVILSTNVLFGVQSVMNKEEGLTGMYYDYAMAAPMMASGDESGSKSILILGMGSGTYAVQCGKYIDNLSIEGVEIDEKIVDLSRRYFGLPEDIPVTIYDGRAYLQAVDQTYDVIMVDAYQDITIPFQMSSAEFFSMIRDHLKEGGVMVVNMNMKGSGEGAINEYLSDTIDSVFKDVYTVDVPGATNRELFASDSGEMIERLSQQIEELDIYVSTGEIQGDVNESAGAAENVPSDTEKSAGADSQRVEQRNRELLSLMKQVENGLTLYRGGDCILTDDKAPVELLGMKVIDELIAEEVAYYRSIYEEEGLSGLLDTVL